MYNNKSIYFSWNKNIKKYIIEVGNKRYEFKTYNKAVNSNIVKSSYDQWLTLKDVFKILDYNHKIKKIELKKLKEGKNVFIDYDDNLDV